MSVQGRDFTCAHCSFRADVDFVAAANVARKLAWLRSRGEQAQAGVTKDERLGWASFARAFHQTHADQLDEMLVVS
jgi:transposase